MAQIAEERTDADVFVPDMEIEEIWVAHPLSLRRTTLLVRQLGAAIARITMKAGELFPDGEPTEDGVLTLIEFLDDQLFLTLLCIVTDQDRKIIEETYTFPKAFDVLVQFWQQEDLSRILGGATRLANKQEFQERTTARNDG